MLIARKRKRHGDNHRSGHDHQSGKEWRRRKECAATRLPFGNGSSQCKNNLGITGRTHVAYSSETGAQRDCRVVRRIEGDLGIGIFDRAQS
jgi:hypothetical protein